jgi:hypothetical protein
MYSKTSREEKFKRPRGRWEDIKMDLKITGNDGVVWIHLAQDRDRWQAVVNTVTNLRIP